MNDDSPLTISTIFDRCVATAIKINTGTRVEGLFWMYMTPDTTNHRGDGVCTC